MTDSTANRAGSPKGTKDGSDDGGRLPRIVAFGGGTGMAALLLGLKAYTDRITAVVTVTDNGGSSGRLRNDFDMAAPGDIRNCIIALADIDPILAEVFQYRFHEAEFKGHCFGNLFITVLNRVLGDFEGSIKVLNRLLKVRGQVIPACNNKVSLVAEHPDGSKSTGEVEITKSRKRIDRIELRPQPVPLSPEIQQAISEGDLFLFGPGSLYTSVVPNLLLDGIMEAINGTGKPRVYIGNIMTQPGETLGYALTDHIRALRVHVGGDFPDAVIAHNGAVPEAVAEEYEKQGAEPVAQDLDGKDEFRSVRVITADFFAGPEGSPPRPARHESALLAKVIHDSFLRSVTDESGAKEQTVPRLSAPAGDEQLALGGAPTESSRYDMGSDGV
ncbi:MAG: uridine diphosphate-N-acetylglucosamine-binding protein YvcK [Planctomycetota bacterium]|nr:uridine diphosphate-N-acetylglucosamine-binding protein YvcK [Planctomycetota bacterium]